MFSLCAVLWGSPVQADDARPAAVFDFELIDTSLDGEMSGTRPDEVARTALVSARLRERLAQMDAYSVVDIAPVADRARASNLQACGRCDIKLAREIGADLAVTGTVWKVSNLILHMTIYVRDTSDGHLVLTANADMRGNTDESWMRTLDWLVDHRLPGSAAGNPK